MTVQWLSLSDRREIAFEHQPGSLATLLFLPGYASDMKGTKAETLAALADRQGLGLIRFDYGGTGQSNGRFEDGTLDRWLEEAEAIAALASGPLILVGSSMGGWLMLLLAERLAGRVIGLIGIAAAPDFTSWGYSEREKAELREKGELRRPNPYGGPSELTTLAFWQSGEKLCLLGRGVAFDGPVRLLHGDRDQEVPLEIAFRLKDVLTSDDVQVTVKGGTHRLSSPDDLALLERTVLALLPS